MHPDPCDSEPATRRATAHCSGATYRRQQAGTVTPSLSLSLSQLSWRVTVTGRPLRLSDSEPNLGAARPLPAATSNRPGPPGPGPGADAPALAPRPRLGESDMPGLSVGPAGSVTAGPGSASNLRSGGRGLYRRDADCRRHVLRGPGDIGPVSAARRARGKYRHGSTRIITKLPRPHGRCICLQVPLRVTGKLAVPVAGPGPCQRACRAWPRAPPLAGGGFALLFPSRSE